ncbi:hypothetical protein ACH4TV_02870 [Streptomyces sp. NPDC020898]|uniref:hypothetical protein n=1 Tax=Streptomyces sp. NPDC020898 TaxID=3365101 RepID=UPI00379990F6
MNSLFSAPEQATLNERTDSPTPDINPFQAPAFREGTLEASGGLPEDFAAWEHP